MEDSKYIFENFDLINYIMHKEDALQHAVDITCTYIGRFPRSSKVLVVGNLTMVDRFWYLFSCVANLGTFCKYFLYNPPDNFVKSFVVNPNDKVEDVKDKLTGYYSKHLIMIVLGAEYMPECLWEALWCNRTCNDSKIVAFSERRRVNTGWHIVERGGVL